MPVCFLWLVFFNIDRFHADDSILQLCWAGGWVGGVGVSRSPAASIGMRATALQRGGRPIARPPAKSVWAPTVRPSAVSVAAPPTSALRPHIGNAMSKTYRAVTTKTVRPNVASRRYRSAIVDCCVVSTYTCLSLCVIITTLTASHLARSWNVLQPVPTRCVEFWAQCDAAHGWEKYPLAANYSCVDPAGCRDLCCRRTCSAFRCLPPWERKTSINVDLSSVICSDDTDCRAKCCKPQVQHLARPQCNTWHVCKYALITVLRVCACVCNACLRVWCGVVCMCVQCLRVWCACVYVRVTFFV